MQPQFFFRRHVLRHQRAQAGHDIAHIAVEKCQHQAVFIAEIIFDQRAVETRTHRQFAQTKVDGIAFAHDLARRRYQLIACVCIFCGVINKRWSCAGHFFPFTQRQL